MSQMFEFSHYVYEKRNHQCLVKVSPIFSFQTVIILFVFRKYAALTEVDEKTPIALALVLWKNHDA